MKRLSSLFALSITACVFAAGCATGSEPGDEPSESATGELGQSVDVPNPAGTYFASITANGTGCPAGTWEGAISEDGQAFTVTFSSYEAMVEPGKAFSIKDCALGIDLRTPKGFSFSVSSFYYQGYSLLDEPGMSARQSAKYYFQGNPVPGVELVKEMTGPYDDSYLFTDEIGVLVWSPCGLQRRLNVNTRLVLRNNPRKTGTGYLNSDSIDGEAKLVFGLKWRHC